MEKMECDIDKASSITQRMSAKNILIDLSKSTDITFNGDQPWDIQVHNDQFYHRVLHEGALGLGESYVDGWWDTECLDVLFHKILRHDLAKGVDVHWTYKLRALLAKTINFQTKKRAKQVAYQHYDLDNDLFKMMLDPYMIYSCGYWQKATNLADAQIAKLDLLCQKLKLKPGQRLLDIGCGWGGLAKYAAEQYGVSVVGITISEQQAALARNICQDLPVDIRVQDYRDINESFDHIVSVGMFEHVGPLNYLTYMKIAHRLLKDSGLFVLHTIGSNLPSGLANQWITKYIFPNGMVPTAVQVMQAAEGLFIVEDWHNFGAYYDNTLMAWHENFAKHWSVLKQKYDDRFYRMWSYYLLTCAGSFRARANQLWQIVFSKKGLEGGYDSPR